MSDSVEIQFPIQMSDAAANKVKSLITEEENPDLKLRVYITGGGCSGFQYGFTFDETINEGDTVIEKNGVIMVIDSMSLQYLVGAQNAQPERSDVWKNRGLPATFFPARAKEKLGLSSRIGEWRK